MVEFVSYDGDYPNLCSGTLVIKVNGKEYSAKYVLMSGGCIYRVGDDYGASKGSWSINLNQFPEEIHKYGNEICMLVNENVPWGCCGGCI